MAQHEIQAVQQQRYDTAPNWTSKNPVLPIAVIGMEIETGKFKIGDGVKAWNAMPYFDGTKTPLGMVALPHEYERPQQNDTVAFAIGKLVVGLEKQLAAAPAWCGIIIDPVNQRIDLVYPHQLTDYTNTVAMFIAPENYNSAKPLRVAYGGEFVELEIKDMRGNSLPDNGWTKDSLVILYRDGDSLYYAGNAVTTVCGVHPDATGNVAIASTDIPLAK